jgi:hypothetical protein
MKSYEHLEKKEESLKYIERRYCSVQVGKIRRNDIKLVQSKLNRQISSISQVTEQRKMKK